ncbi:LysR family transcriptional regulator [Azohydromonas australica]|uniref:LysR family transcriptional regulator n=1 Tax=Azohydromonas australica TaxID=364039 RepID=UPI0004060205|nr:LysR family transcriptional regulator [Azohydromonas australica]
MMRSNFDDLFAFVAVAREGSFTRAAAQLGVSQAALSYTIRQLEERLGYRLLTRTTRSVSPTEAGARVLATLAPRFEEMQAELTALSELRDKPAGTIRITTSDHAADAVLLPKLARLLPEYPDIKVEIVIDYALTDIVAQRFDVGVRLGDQVAKDMIAVRISPDIRMAVVATPGYFERHAKPEQPEDLMRHNCINMRLPTYGGLYAWEFEKNGHKLSVRVEGQTTFNTLPQTLYSALAGLGVAYIAQDIVQPHIDAGRLVPVLRDWCPTFTGFHLYYPSRRQSSRVLGILVEALRYRA